MSYLRSRPYNCVRERPRRRAAFDVFVLKDISADDLVSCNRDVLAGKTYLAPAAAAKLAEGVTRVQLTPREMATLRLLGQVGLVGQVGRVGPVGQVGDVVRRPVTVKTAVSRGVPGLGGSPTFTAFVRLVTPSFSKRCARSVFTVRSLMSRSLAISLFALPSALPDPPDLPDLLTFARASPVQRELRRASPTYLTYPPSLARVLSGASYGLSSASSGGQARPKSPPSLRTATASPCRRSS
jgi:hypothetical protein